MWQLCLLLNVVADVIEQWKHNDLVPQISNLCSRDYKIIETSKYLVSFKY